MEKIKQIIVSLCIMLLVASTIHPVSVFAVGDVPDVPSNPTVQQAKPNLQILNTQTHRVYSQKENTIRFHLNNTSRFTATGIQVKPDLSADKSVPGVRILSTTLVPNNQSISPDSSREYELKMIVDDSVKEGIYPIYLNVSYKNNSNDPFQTTLLLYYDVRKDETKLEKIEITDENFNSLQPTAESDISFEYKIKNDTDYQIKNVKTRIEGLPAEFTLKSASDIVVIGNLMPLIAKPVSFEYYIKEDVKSGSYPFTVVFEYDNQDGQRIIRQEKYNIFVAPTTSSKVSGKLKYSGFSYPKSVVQDAEFPISFQLTNDGKKEVKDVTVKIAENPVFLPKTPSIVKFDQLAAGESKTFSVTVVGTGESLKDRNYPINFEISYKTSDAKDAAPTVDTQIIGIYLDANEEKNKDKDSEKNLPKIILDEYKLEPNIVQAGQEFELEMVFKNTNQTKDIYNVKAFLTFDVATGKDTVQQNVFSPVNSSNTFFINKISSDQGVSKKLRMYVVPDAEPKTYTVTVNFEYEDKDGKQITSKELVGIPVKQTTRVETSELTIPESADLGREVTATFNLFNTGKAKVSNLVINVSGNFKAEPNNQYIGNFDVGQSNNYEGYLTFHEPGEQSGKFIISYDDQTGQKYTIEKEFSILVNEVIDMPSDFGPDGMYPITPEMPAKSGLPIAWIVGGIIGLIALVLVVIAILRKRKHKKEMNSYENN